MNHRLRFLILLVYLLVFGSDHQQTGLNTSKPEAWFHSSRLFHDRFIHGESGEWLRSSFRAA